MVKISVEIRKRGNLPLGYGSRKPTAGHWEVWDKEKPQHGWVPRWLDHSSEAGGWLGIQLWSWVISRGPRISSHVVLWIWLSHFPRPCSFSVWTLTLGFTTVHGLCSASSMEIPERDCWIGLVTPVGWSAFGQVLSLWSNQSSLGGRLS